MAALAPILDVVKSKSFLTQIQVVEKAIKYDVKSGSLDLLAVELASQDAIDAAKAELAKTQEPSTSEDLKVAAAKKAIAHANNALNLWITKANALESIPADFARKIEAIRGVQAYFLELMETYNIPLIIESPSAIAARHRVATEEEPLESPRGPRRPTPPGLTPAAGRFSVATGLISPEVAAALTELHGGGEAAPTIAITPGTHYFAVYLKALLKFYKANEEKLRDVPKFKDFKNALRGEILAADAFRNGSVAVTAGEELKDYILSHLQMFKGYDRPRAFARLTEAFGLQETKHEGASTFSLNPAIVIGFDATSLRASAETLRTSQGFSNFELDEEESKSLSAIRRASTRRVSIGPTTTHEIPRYNNDVTHTAAEGAFVTAALSGGASAPAPEPAPAPSGTE